MRDNCSFLNQLLIEQPEITYMCGVATTVLESIPRLHDEEVENSQGDIPALCAAIHKVVKPVNNTSMPPRYRRAMVKVLVKRACEGL